MPSQLLERRPDLQQAEENLIAANANVGVAKANFFPTISLTGVLGGVSPRLSELAGAGRAWSLAGNLAGPLFTAGRLKNEYRAALAQRDQAKIAFEKSVTQAFGEVSTSLSAHQELAKAYAEQLDSVEALVSQSGCRASDMTAASQTILRSLMRRSECIRQSSRQSSTTSVASGARRCLSGAGRRLESE